MSPIHFIPKGNKGTCRITKSGSVSIPQKIIDEVGWSVGQIIELHFTRSPLIMNLKPGNVGYKLSYLNRNSSTPHGGKLSIHKFTDEVLKPRVELPAAGLVPIYMENADGFILLVKEPDWVEEEFSMTGCKNVDTSFVGVYELLGAGGETLRIGKGIVRSRLLEHLKNEKFVKQTRSFRYAPVEPSKELRFVERVLFARYKRDHDGNLPPLNLITG